MKLPWQTGPRGLDPHIKARLTDGSLKRYRTCIQRFLAFIIDNKFDFSDYGEIDDLLVEFKNACAVSKADFETTIAAIEFALPGAKGQLPWSRTVAKSWSSSHVPQHTVPMCEGPAVLIGCHMSSRNHPRLGGGLIIQNALGLRPSELLGIAHEDIMLPEDRGESLSGTAVVGLGMRHGTKAKRPQTVTLSSAKKVALLRWLKRNSRTGQHVVGCSYTTYRQILADTTAAMGLKEIGFTPHSPRSGFATQCISAGLGFSRTRELGRWVSESSLRTYLDLTAASGIQVNLQTRHLAAAQAYCCAHVLDFFIGSKECYFPSAPSSVTVHATDGSQRLEAAGRRPLLPAGAAPSLVDGESAISVTFTDSDSSEEMRHTSRGHGRGNSRGGGRHVRFDDGAGRQVRGRGRH